MVSVVRSRDAAATSRHLGVVTTRPLPDYHSQISNLNTLFADLALPIIDFRQ
jgi:hypothetical protein